MKRIIKFRKSIMLLVKALIVASMTCAFVDVWRNFYPQSVFSQRGNYIVVLAYVLIFFTFTNLYGGFSIGFLRLHEIIYSFALSTTFTNGIMYLIFCLIARQMLPVWPTLLSIICQFALGTVGAYCGNGIYFGINKSRRILALYANEETGKNIVRKMSLIPEKYWIEQAICINDKSVEELKELIDNYSSVLLCDIIHSTENELLTYCYSKKKRIYILPSSNDIIINNCHMSQVFDTPILLCRNRGLTMEQMIIKRLMDLTLSIIGLIIASPIMAVTALAIKLSNDGPVLFKQNRITADGKIFNVLKFRSMVYNPGGRDTKGATDNDDRITKVGKIIRPLRIDELPQLFNIIKGDMSVVGPRPERIENVYNYTEKLPEFSHRHRMKAGLTGYAQIYGKYNTSPEDKLNMDLTYIEKYSILLDIKLMLMTIKILFMKESTEGFAETKEDESNGKV